MEIIAIASKMEEIISEIQFTIKKLPGLAEAKARAKSDYEKELALTGLKLEAGRILEYEGLPIGKLTANDRERLAKGICAEYRYECEKADAFYKAAVVKMSGLESMLNGYQSVGKYSEYSNQ